MFNFMECFAFICLIEIPLVLFDIVLMGIESVGLKRVIRGYTCRFAAAVVGRELFGAIISPRQWRWQWSSSHPSCAKSGTA